MTPQAFMQACHTLRWTHSQVAHWCGYSRAAGCHWAAGRAAIPPVVGIWLFGRLIGDLSEPPPRTDNYTRTKKQPRAFQANPSLR